MPKPEPKPIKQLVANFCFCFFHSGWGLDPGAPGAPPPPELKKKEKEAKNLESEKTDIGWGHQIRSYILHPYRLVKDNRTNYESSDPDKVLNGEIDAFLESSLHN